MSTTKSLLLAAGITAVAVFTLTFIMRRPTLEQLSISGITIFTVAFALMKFWSGDNKKE